MTLRSLSDKEILSRIHDLTSRERKLTLAVLLHLNEIERRKLHLKHGYASMFDYCTSGLGYSASAAGRRIQTSRCIARFPEIRELLESNRVNLTTVSLVSRILTNRTKDEIIPRICGKSQREVKAIVAEYEPREAIPRDQVRAIVVKTAAVPAANSSAVLVGVTAAAAATRGGKHLPDRPCETSSNSRCGSAPDSRDGQPASPGGAVAGSAQLERLAMIQFCASEAFMAKFEKVKSLVWHRLPANPSLEQVFELALDLLIEREDPSRRQERRVQRASRDANRPTKVVEGARKPRENPRRVPADVRDRVFVRDKGQCAFRGPDGRRCTSTTALQVDHVRPVARGGGGTADNLRLLCAYHNRLEAVRLMGSCGSRDGT